VRKHRSQCLSVDSVTPLTFRRRRVSREESRDAPVLSRVAEEVHEHHVVCVGVLNSRRDTRPDAARARVEDRGHVETGVTKLAGYAVRDAVGVGDRRQAVVCRAHEHDGAAPRPSC
jgi:hypothetical protein